MQKEKKTRVRQRSARQNFSSQNWIGNKTETAPLLSPVKTNNAPHFFCKSSFVDKFSCSAATRRGRIPDPFLRMCLLLPPHIINHWRSAKGNWSYPLGNKAHTWVTLKTECPQGKFSRGASLWKPVRPIPSAALGKEAG